LNLGQFAVKCYPYVDASVFDSFSPQEREMVTGELFDHTHTPSLETQQEIHEAFFSVGSISFALDAAETVALFTFDSLDFLRWSALTTKTGSENNLPEKSIIRNIPGWRIGYSLFDRLVSLYAFYSKQPPAFIGVTRSPGFECIIDTHKTPENRLCDDIQHWSTSVLFVNAAETGRWIDTIWRVQLDTEERIVFEHAFSHSACDHVADDGMPQDVINSLWWDLAHADLKSGLTSTCGCGDHENHAVEAE